MLQSVTTHGYDEFLARVAGVFHTLDRPYLARIDARDAIDAVQRRVLAVVRDRLGLP